MDTCYVSLFVGTFVLILLPSELLSALRFDTPVFSLPRELIYTREILV